MISEDKVSILRCPTCESDLSQEGTYLVCINCNSRFPIVDGIVVLLTKAHLAEFLNETWGQELQKENSDAFPGFAFASNEDAIEDLRKISEEAAGEGKASRGLMADVFPPDPDLPEELELAVRKSADDIIRLSRAESAKAILDWPTGWGFCLKNLANNINAEALIVALEVNFRTLAKIKPFYDKNGFSDNMLFIVADARRMPFKDGAFQSITAWGGTTEIASPELGWKETFRVLRKGGWFGISGDQYRDDSPSMKLAEQCGIASKTLTRERLEANLGLIGFGNLEYEVLFEGYDTDLDTPDEERCPLPARGDWFQHIVAAGQK
jgi:uncharacterized protein YbaR (Trm112 family)